MTKAVSYNQRKTYMNLQFCTWFSWMSQRVLATIAIRQKLKDSGGGGGRGGEGGGRRSSSRDTNKWWYDRTRLYFKLTCLFQPYLLMFCLFGIDTQPSLGKWTEKKRATQMDQQMNYKSELFNKSTLRAFLKLPWPMLILHEKIS